jgi:hypothetical protein
MTTECDDAKLERRTVGDRIARLGTWSKAPTRYSARSAAPVRLSTPRRTAIPRCGTARAVLYELQDRLDGMERVSSTTHARRSSGGASAGVPLRPANHRLERAPRRSDVTCVTRRKLDCAEGAHGAMSPRPRLDAQPSRATPPRPLPPATPARPPAPATRTAAPRTPGCAPPARPRTAAHTPPPADDDAPP